MENWLNKHYAVIALIGGTLATIISVTVYAMTTFSTKQELKDAIDSSEKGQTVILQSIDKRLERIEDAVYYKREKR